MVKKCKNKSKRVKRKSTILFDIPALKKAIKEELYSKYSSHELDKLKNKAKENCLQISNEEEEKIYNLKYSKYMLEEFNPKIVNMIISYLNKSKSLPFKYKIETDFIFKFINLLKHLLMNEFEISYFTIMLDKIGWGWQNVEKWTYFCILGIYIKTLCGGENDSSLLINLISRNSPEFMDIYTNWLYDENIENIIQGEEMSVKTINERFRQLTRPINTYCRKNYIIYSGIADKIVKLSQPYGEESNANQLRCNEQFHTNNGIIDNNEIKVMSTVYGSLCCGNYNRRNDLNYLKENLILQPVDSNACDQKRKNNVGLSLLSQSKLSIDEINQYNQYNPSIYNLSLFKKGSSQLSLKLDNF